MNKWNFTGNLGRDAEVKTLQNGTVVCSFPVAVSSGYGDNKKTTWASCALFGKRAEGGLVQYLTKGAQVAVSGELNLDEWVNQDGANKAAVKVRVDDIDLIGGNQNRQPAGAAQQPQQRQQMQPQAPQQQAPMQQAPQHSPQQIQAHQQERQQQQPQQQPQSFDNFDQDIPF